MSEELEAFELAIYEFEKELEDDCNNEWLKRVIAGTKKCYQRLKAIENSNPSEALECVEDLIFNFSVDEYVERYDNNLQVIKQALIQGEQDRKNLELVDKVRSGKTIIFVGKGLAMMNADKYHEYLKMEEEPISKKIKKCLKEQALEIIKEKNVDVLAIKESKTLEEYNRNAWEVEHYGRYNGFRLQLTQEEFDLLKEVLEWLKNHSTKENPELEEYH